MTTEIKEILSGEIAGKVRTQGFVETVREHKKYLFVILRERSDLLQVFVDRERFPTLDIGPEYFVRVSGSLKRDEQISLHGIELDAESIEILSKPSKELPISHRGTGYPSLSERLEHRHLSLREPKIALAFEMMSHFDFKIREFLFRERFLEIHTPKIIGTSSEGGAELFEISYFGGKAYLAQSPQIYKQMAIGAGMGKVFEIAPAFRADPSFTTRHVTEITMIDIEMGPISHVDEIMDLEERMIEYTMRSLAEEFADKAESLYGIKLDPPSLPFPRIEFKEARKILKEKYGMTLGEDEDLTSETEKRIGEYAKEVYGHDFVFVTRYPSRVRAFYTMKDEADPEYSHSFDLLYRGLEITSGAQREHRPAILAAQIEERGMGLEGFKHYLELFSHSIPTHGGFGLGFARLFKQMLGYETIKEVIMVPRDPKRIFP